MNVNEDLFELLLTIYSSPFPFLPVLPHRLALFDECAQAFLGILKIKQLVQVDVLCSL